MSFNGLFLIDKPSGVTSHDVVASARRSLKMREVGHAGTLDPLASGLMVLLLGEGTKLSDYILSGNKTYELRVKLGVKTDTLDITGQILQQKSVNFDPDVIVKMAEQQQGEFAWPVPLFSAKKVDGRKLYEYAHNKSITDEAPVIPTKVMKFWGFKKIDVGSDYLVAQISCSKGSFIRTWADQLGEKLGVGGVIESLRRIESAPYGVEKSITLEDLAQGDYKQAFVSMDATLPGWKTITVRGKDEKLIYNGQISHDLDRRLIIEKREAIRSQQSVGIKVISPEGQLISILEAQPMKGLKIRRVFKSLEGIKTSNDPR